MEMTPEDWVCPWRICTKKQAQECRAEMHPRKGCGGKFPNMTAEQAKLAIQPHARGSDMIHQAVLDERKACAEIAGSVAMHYYCEHVDPELVSGDETEAYKACEEIEKAINGRT